MNGIHTDSRFRNTRRETRDPNLMRPSQKSPNLALKVLPMSPMTFHDIHHCWQKPLWQTFRTFICANFAMSRWWFSTALISLLNEICTGKHFGVEWLAKPEGPKAHNSDICLFPLVEERTTSQNTCVSSVCDLRTFDTGPFLSHSCSLFVHHLVPNLKSTSQRFFESIVSEYYYAFFMGYKVRTDTCNIIFQISNINFESFSRTESSFSHENPSWLSKWNLTKWIIGFVLSEASEILNTYIQLSIDVSFCHWEPRWQMVLHSHGPGNQTVLVLALFEKVCEPQIYKT